MKNSIALLIAHVGFLGMNLTATAQVYQWTWVDGSRYTNSMGSYHELRTPGARHYSTSVEDEEGNLWLFGGEGSDESSSFGRLNDLWKYEINTGIWTWISGSNEVNQNGTYGTQGIASTSNFPGCRVRAVAWIDSIGNFWLFGGFGRGASGSSTGFLNDLWKFDISTSQWTWVKGSNSINGSGSWGTQGTASASNTPSGRGTPMCWSDTNGNLWMLGGEGFPSSSSTASYLQDLWKFEIDSNQWTWVKGSAVGNPTGNYGTQGNSAYSNMPGGRHHSACWIDSQGHFWLFGGYGYAASGSSGGLNDLWSYNPITNQWIWISGSNSTNASGSYGTQGTASSSNSPGARSGAVGWADTADNIWIFAGLRYSNRYNDLWKFDQSSGHWTWVKGSSSTNTSGTYGTMGVTNSTSTPGARFLSTNWIDPSGKLWIFGGNGASTVRFNDLWRFDPVDNNWTWMKGSSNVNNSGIYGNVGVLESRPGAREKQVGWVDNQGNFWFFGGNGYGASIASSMNDMWKYSPSTNEWSWMKGHYNGSPNGTYGTQGVAADSNNPGSRVNLVSWTDTNGNLWLFGGNGNSAYGFGRLNDLWKFDTYTNQWTWMKGSNSANQAGTYGTLGTADSANNPGGRYGSVSWTDASGNLWLFGGSGGNSRLNDLWRYNPTTNQWTWIKGSNGPNQSGIYGAQGTASANNTPGAREGAVSWVDTSGNFWLFGGWGYAASGSGYLNDLWKYIPTTNQWIWMKGSNSANSSGVYGTLGTAGTSNVPGPRQVSISWRDNIGNLWLLGGFFSSATSGIVYMNDLWKYSPTTNNWTWMKGSNIANQNGTYGTQGMGDTANSPGARHESVSWVDFSGNLWLFGGYGYADTGTIDLMNDLWRLDTCTLPSTPSNVTNASNLSICLGSNTTLSANGGGTLSWYATATSTTVLDTGTSFTTPTLTTTTTYYVESYTCASSSRTAITVTVNPTPTVSITTNPATGIVCSGNNMTLTATGGGTYAWSDSVSNSTPFMPSASSIYTVTVTSSAGCTTTSSVSITVVTLPTVNLSNTDISCYGVNNGQATASASGGTSPFIYIWSNSSNGSTATGLGAGTYTVTVTDNNGCSGTASTTITQPTQLSAVLSVTNISCYGGANGTVTANVSGGTSNYTYAWNNSSTATSLTSLTSGTYSVTVTDANSCTAVASVFLSEPNAVAASIAATNISCFGQTNGSLTASATGGTGAINYLWNTSATANTISSLSAGTYTVTATDALGCTGTATASVSQPSSAVSVSISSSINVLCFNGSTGQATASATGGTGTKTYAWSGGGTSATKSNMTAGTYTVTATDQNGCTATTTVSITQPATSVSVSIGSVTNASCNGGSNAQATASGTGGTGSITYAWSGGGTSATKTNMAAGTYTLTATDDNGCTATATVAITQPAAISLGLTPTSISCNGGTNGQVSASGSGGTGALSYTWNTGSTASSISGLTAGTYTVTATDQNACTMTATAVVTQPSALSINISTTNISCNGGTNGSATASATGGTGTKTYLWSTSATAANISSLATGTYTVTATDANGCTTTGSVSISEPATALSVSITSQTNVFCVGTSTGSATATAVGGTGTKTYSWSGGGTSATKTNLSAGTYTVTAADANGCTATTSVTITQSGTAVAVSISSTDLQCNGVPTGTATATASGGSGSGYTYIWTGSVTGATRTALAAGTYTVTATDGGGCSSTASITITQPTAITIPTMARTATTCFGGSGGTITANPSGGAGSYTYLWSSGSTANPVTNLSAGTYTVTVTDASGCTKTATRQVLDVADISANLTVTNVGCQGGSDGVISASISGGTGTKTRLWSTGSTATSITGLTAGTYSITVTDANGCTKTNSATVTQPASGLSVNIGSITNVNCNGGNDGQAAANATGGTATYTYSWNGGATSATNTSMTAGTYTVTVTDANGCTASTTAEITEPTAINLSIGSVTHVSCNGGSNAQATATANGGTGTITYLWSSGGTNATVTGMSAGNYTVTATDANACTATAIVNITEPSALAATTSITGVNCFGEANGTATVTASGGTGSMTYSWNTGETATNHDSLIAGTYTVTVTDQNNCTVTATAEVTQPLALSISMASVTNVSCNGGSDGQVEISVSGGTASYSYLWNGGYTTSTLSALSAGTYTVAVVDANSCTSTSSVTITQPATPLTVSIGSVTNVLCFGSSTGSATASGSGGTGTISFEWSNSINTAINASLTVGNYTVTATDANGCTATSSVTITQPSSALSVTSSGTTNVLCFGGNTGSAAVNASGGTGSITYLWTGGGSSSTNTSLTAGTYTVTVTDENACTATVSATINQPSSAVSASISGTTNVLCFGNSTGSATCVGSGGTGTKTYNWTSGATTSTISGLSAGTYSVTVTDANGCSTTTSATIVEPASAVATTISNTSVLCFGTSTGTATAAGSGGTGTLTYAWSGGGTNAQQSNLAVGTYTVTVTDANGCSTSATVVITQPTELSSTNTVTNVSCNGGTNGSATVAATGGTSSYTYLWSNSSTSTTASGLLAGVYTVTVTDANSCTTTSEATITEPAQLIATVESAAMVTCHGLSNGNVTANANGGTQPYTFAWNTGSTSPSISGLTAGLFAVVVVDSNGCTDSTNILITQPDSLIASLAGVEPLCYGDFNGSIMSSVFGGTEPYAYLWNTSSSTQSIVNINAGAYTLTITDSLGCVVTDSIYMSQPDSLYGEYTVLNETCLGMEDGAITVNPQGGTIPYSYIWSNGAGSQVTNNAPLAAGIYAVTVIDDHNCQSSDSVLINPGNPYPEPTLGADTIVTTGLAILLDPGTYASYIWQDSTTDSVFTATATGTYSVSVFDSIGCMGADTIDVVIWPTGISTIGNNTLIVYPNPNFGAFTLEWTGEASQTELHDIAGRIVWKGHVNKGKNAIHLSDPRAGVYMLRLQNNEQTINQRVVVE